MRSCSIETNLPLTRLQAALKEYLRQHSGETISREELCSAVWQMNYFRWSRTIDQTVSVVRKHIGRDERIVTVFGIGYRHEYLGGREKIVAARATGDVSLFHTNACGSV